MDRRDFVRSLGAVLGAASLAARAQSRMPRVGFLGNGDPKSNARQLEAFRQGLRELALIEGTSIAIEYRWAEGHVDRLPALAAQLVTSKVDVLLVSGRPAVSAAQQATRTIPIVFVILTDPVMLGFVNSLARPGGNMTGVASQFEDLITKQLQLLKEAVPTLTMVALLHRTETPPVVLRGAEDAARSLGLKARSLSVASGAEFEGAFRIARDDRVGAVHVLPSPFFDSQRAQLNELAARYRLPACYEFRNYVEDGGLMSYGPSINAMYERSARYVDLILKGATPGDLPIERPAKFELVINLKTAAALGMVMPQALISRADDVLS
jgi:putative ABC transport system substrate-binding protein